MKLHDRITTCWFAVVLFGCFICFHRGCVESQTVWPAPQFIEQGDHFFVIDPDSFEFKISNAKAASKEAQAFLSAAFSRYTALIFNEIESPGTISVSSVATD